jgi:hypothetical protein
VPQQRSTFLGEAIRALNGVGGDTALHHRMVKALEIAGETGRRGGADSALKASPEGLLAARVAELAVRIATAPVPLLLATPTLANGTLDAAVLAARLARAEAEGWEPWPLDLEQALLRVPRGADPAVAAGLSSPAGKQLAAYLAAGGLPDPVSIRVEQRVDPRSGMPSWGPPPVPQRVLVSLEPAGTGGLRLAEQLVTLFRRPSPRFLSSDFFLETDILTMVLPHHREVCAAWSMVRLAALADQDFRTGGELLPLLADCDGPFGPAMTLALAYVLAARHESDRVAGVDAFLTFAAREVPSGGALPRASAGALPGASFAAGVGAEIGALCGADSLVKLTRVVPALADAHRAGASAAVWDVLAAALPLLAPKQPRGLPDLLELATQVARAVSAHGEIAEVAALAGRGGSSRLVKEAKRLQSVLSA